MVVAESRALAKDAVEAVLVDWEPLPAVTGIKEALADGAPIVHEEFGTNDAGSWSIAGDSPVPTRGPSAPFFDDPDLVKIKEEYYLARLIPNAMEPRGIVVDPNVAMGEYTVYTATQIPHILRTALVISNGIPEAKLRVVAPDVGGGFGSKLEVYPEDAICLAVAQKLGRPIKWIEERSENYLATLHGREMFQQIELAATRDGDLKAVRVKLTASMGAYLRLITPGIPMLGAWLYHGCYECDGYDFEYTNVFTNTTFTDAYRGAGRPEATYAIERAMDALARELDMDPVELRRKNFIATESFPNYTIASGLTVDSADYHGTLDECLEVLDYDGIRADQKARRERGDRKLLGVGFSTWIEMCGLAPSRVLSALNYAAGGWDSAKVELMPTGTVRVLTGVSPHGQGSRDGVRADRGRHARRRLRRRRRAARRHSDDAVRHGHLRQPRRRGRRRRPAPGDREGDREGAHARGARARVLRGRPRVRKRRVHDQGHGTAASASSRSRSRPGPPTTCPTGMEPGLQASHLYDPPNFSWPNGAHCCVVEVDQDTGLVEIVRYIAVDDCGVQLNPMLVQGQVHGGAAQGIAEALYEEAIYDGEGNLSTGTMTNYLVPGAARAPDVRGARPVHAVADEPDGREGHRRGGHDRGAAGGDQRGRRRAVTPRRPLDRASGHARTRLASDPGGKGGPVVIPATFDYEVAESVDQAIELLGASGEPEAARRRAEPAAADEAPARAAGDADRPRRHLRLRRGPRRRRPPGDRRAHAPPRARARPARRGALPAARPRGGTGRRPAGAPPRDDRRLARPRAIRRATCPRWR